MALKDLSLRMPALLLLSDQHNSIAQAENVHENLRQTSIIKADCEERAEAYIDAAIFVHDLFDNLRTIGDAVIVGHSLACTGYRSDIGYIQRKRGTDLPPS